MKTYRNGKSTQARASDGSFRKWTGDDFGIGSCPKCNSITVQPARPANLDGAFIDPFVFNKWNRARVCSCGWKNEEAEGLEPKKA